MRNLEAPFCPRHCRARCDGLNRIIFIAAHGAGAARRWRLREAAGARRVHHRQRLCETMDSALADIAGGSVHVRNGEIVAVGKDVKGGGQKVL